MYVYVYLYVYIYIYVYMTRVAEKPGNLIFTKPFACVPEAYRKPYIYNPFARVPNTNHRKPYIY